MSNIESGYTNASRVADTETRRLMVEWFNETSSQTAHERARLAKVVESRGTDDNDVQFALGRLSMMNEMLVGVEAALVAGSAFDAITSGPFNGLLIEKTVPLNNYEQLELY